MAQRPPRWTYFIITVLVILAALLALSVVAPGPTASVRVHANSD
jgi:hypothetical protein